MLVQQKSMTMKKKNVLIIVEIPKKKKISFGKFTNGIILNIQNV